jgi:uncharacterized coiled-coil protein SlyX
MWISEPQGRPTWSAARRLALDGLVLAVVLALLPEWARVRAGVALEPHPGWIAVLALAARYGSAGLFTGLVAAAGAVGIGSAVAGAGLAAALSHLDSGPNLVAFGACLAVSWVGSRQVRRQAHLCARLRALSHRAAESAATVEALRDVVVRLRARVDRTSASLSFLRDVAARLEGTDPVAAAEGAAELALMRTGACAVAVEVGTRGLRRRLAVRDARGPRMLTPLVLDDADLIVPIRSGTDPIGVIALWGIRRSALDEATKRDLELIASWCVPTLGIIAWRPAATADRARRAG